MTSKHDYKNLSNFVDAKKGANEIFSNCQILPSGLMLASDGRMAAMITTDIHPVEVATTVVDGTAFLKAMVADPDARVVADKPDTLSVGEAVFATVPTPRARCYNLMINEIVAANYPGSLYKFGFFASHGAVLGRMKTDKGKPAIVQLAFRGRALAFTVSGSSCGGIAMANTLPIEESDQGVLL